MILSKGVSTCIQASCSPSSLLSLQHRAGLCGLVELWHAWYQHTPCCSTDTGAGLHSAAAQRTWETVPKETLGNDFLVKWTLVYVNHCQKTQMHLVDLALRFHGQKLQRETWVHTGAGNKSCYQQRHLNVSQCKAPQGSPSHFRDSCWPLLNVNQS